MGDQIVEVLCYSGGSYADRPQALVWQGQKIKVKQILNNLRTPNSKVFEVLLENGWKVQLEYREMEDLWTASGLLSAEQYQQD